MCAQVSSSVLTGARLAHVRTLTSLDPQIHRRNMNMQLFGAIDDAV